MKVVNATWEKRNLGVATMEIVTESSDTIEDLKTALSSIDSPYSVLKIPANKVELSIYAEDHGYRFIETQLVLLGKVKQIAREAEKILLRNKCFSVETDNSSGMFDYIASKINEGIFQTDRIAVDPFFNQKIANVRYANWLLDLKNDESAHMQIMKRSGNIVAFNLNKRSGTCSHGLIGGLLKEYQHEPLGMYWGAAILKNVSECADVDLWEATVSSNNYSVIKIWEYLGMQISNISSVFVKHC